MYVRAHLFMGFDVNLQAQCDWIAQLQMLRAQFPNDTKIYAGHGAAGLYTKKTQPAQRKGFLFFT